MKLGLDQQSRAVDSGYWPLIRYDPVARAAGANPCSTRRDPGSRWPTTPTASCATARSNSDPAEAERLHGLAEEAVAERREAYEEMATRGRIGSRPTRARTTDGPWPPTTWV